MNETNLSKNNNNNEFSKLVLSGFVSGFVSSFLCHPLESLKVNSQYSKYSYYSNYSYYSKGIKGIISKGCIISPISYGLHYSIYYTLYSVLKENNCSPFISGFIAQGISSNILNPLWIIRTQRMAGIDYSVIKKNIINNYSLSRSIIPNTIMGLQSGITFSIIESLLLLNIDPVKSSFIGKTLSSVILYPVDTFRNNSRIDTSEKLSSIFKTILKNKGFYNGLVYHLLKSVPAFVITNTIFEKLKYY